MDLEAIVRSVLPALNLDPASFSLDRGFLARARRSGKPRVLAFNGLKKQLVFVGTRAAGDPNAMVDAIATEALVALAPEARAACEGLAVAWSNPDGQLFAAAFLLSSQGAAKQPSGMSWSAPEDWPDPMIDVSRTPDESFGLALQRLAAVVRARRGPGEPFPVRFDRALKLVGVVLRRFGGEAPDPSTAPEEQAPDAEWTDWLARHSRSLRDEWRRARGENQPLARAGQMAMAAERSRPLAHLKVFLSYARPDATTLATPVERTLASLGASVWFDQNAVPDAERVATGFSDIIRGCDAFVMCASDEFVERGGYATQEFAWAMEDHGPQRKLRYFVVVSRPGTVLPSAVAAWPRIEFTESGEGDLAQSLQAALLGAPPFLGTVPPRVRAPSALAPLARDANLPAVLLRAQHVRLFREIPVDALTRLATQGNVDRETAEVRDRLLRLAEVSSWSGTLGDIDDWPEDSWVRDVRLRFGGSRAVAGVRWPLSGEFGSSPEAARDIEYLATQPVPVLGWPTLPGWDESERRYALRHHAGLLRVLHGLLQRGLCNGLIGVPSATLRSWEHGLVERRRECHDGLLELRLRGDLGWKGVPPTWDQFYSSWRELLLHPQSWHPPVVPLVLQALVQNVTSVAAVGAEVGWYASRSRMLAAQVLEARVGQEPLTIEVSSSPAGTALFPPAAGDGEITVGLVSSREPPPVLWLRWNGSRFGARGGAATESTMPIPRRLYRSNLPSA